MLTPEGPDEPPALKSEDLVEAWRLARREEDRQEVFRTIFTRYYPFLLHFFSRRGFPPDDSKDLTQETLLRAYTKMDLFRGQADLRTWLLRIASNVLSNAVRARHASKRSGSEVPLPTGNEPILEAAAAGPREPSQLSQLLDREREAMIRVAIQELPVQMRRCLLLRVDQDLQYRDIAALLRISIDTVKAHLFQARQRLKSALRGYFEDIDV